MTRLASFPNARQIEAEACAWIAQLDGGKPSQEDLDAFREWVQRSPHHQAEIKRLSGLWSDLNVLTELAVPLKKTSPWTGLFTLKAGVASIVVVIGVALVTYFTRHLLNLPNATEAPYYATAVGEQKAISLSDGSKVLINTASRIEVDYSADERVIRLLQGEAFFQVSHDTSRPFLVYAGADVVRAVGTAFSVQVRKSDVAVVVTEGSVELSSASNVLQKAGPQGRALHGTRLATVTAGQSATVDDKVEILQTVPPAEVKRKLSWREGMLSFSGEK
jgi:transmembrane sensor